MRHPPRHREDRLPCPRCGDMVRARKYIMRRTWRIEYRCPHCGEQVELVGAPTLTRRKRERSARLLAGHGER